MSSQEQSPAAEPIQHGPGCMQFKCLCGNTTTFAPNSQCFKPLANLHKVGPRVDVGECPYCGRKHWRGMTRKECR